MGPTKDCYTHVYQSIEALPILRLLFVKCVCVSTPVSKGINLAISTASARKLRALYRNSAAGELGTL